MTWPNGTAVEETIKALSAKLTTTEARLAETQAALAELVAEHDRVMVAWSECVEARKADYERAPFAFVATDSASAVQPERCCLDYPRCDCNSPPEPDDDWLCFRSPAQPKVTR
jgi:hypothetical protein